MKTRYEEGTGPHGDGKHVCGGMLRKIDNSELDPRLTPYYNSGQRVEVTYSWGQKERFYVGKSTGWKPVYLIIKRKDSSGGMAVMPSDMIVSIRPVGKSRAR